MKNNQTLKFMQGDVQGRTATLPKGAIKVKHRPIALGEVSGHMHCMTGDVELFEFEGRTFAVVGSEGACLQHVHESRFSEKLYSSKKVLEQADHKHIELPPGTYELVIQNQYNPFKKIFEQVKD